MDIPLRNKVSKRDLSFPVAGESSPPEGPARPSLYGPKWWRIVKGPLRGSTRDFFTTSVPLRGQFPFTSPTFYAFLRVDPDLLLPEDLWPDLLLAFSYSLPRNPLP